MIICKSNKSRSWWVDLHPQLTSTAHGPRYLWLMDSNAYVLEGTGWTLGAGLIIVYHFIISYTVRKVYKESIYRWVDLQTSVLRKGGYQLKMLCKGVWEMWKQLCTVTCQQDRKQETMRFNKFNDPALTASGYSDSSSGDVEFSKNQYSVGSNLGPLDFIWFLDHLRLV